MMPLAPYAGKMIVGVLKSTVLENVPISDNLLVELHGLFWKKEDMCC